MCVLSERKTKNRIKEKNTEDKAANVVKTEKFISRCLQTGVPERGARGGARRCPPGVLF